MERLDIALRRAIYRHFADTGQAPAAADVAATREDLRRLEQAHAVVLDEGGGIAFANPFAAPPAPYAVKAAGRSWGAICAWDALGVLAALDLDGRVTAGCPDCGEPLSVEVAGGELEPTAAVAHFLVPAASWYADLAFT